MFHEAFNTPTECVKRASVSVPSRMFLVSNVRMYVCMYRATATSSSSFDTRLLTHRMLEDSGNDKIERSLIEILPRWKRSDVSEGMYRVFARFFTWRKKPHSEEIALGNLPTLSHALTVIFTYMCDTWFRSRENINANK